MGISKTQCTAVSGLVFVGATIALLAVSLTSPTFFRSYYVPPPEGSHFVYPTDSYGSDCEVANIGLLRSKYNPLCSGGILSGTEPFEVPTTEYYPLFPIRFISHKYNPLNRFGLEYQGCPTTIDAMYALGSGQAQGSLTGLNAVLDQLPDQLFASSALWQVPAGQGYQILQGALAASGQDAATIQSINATLVPVLLQCTAAATASKTFCKSVLSSVVLAAGEETINGYLTIAFNKEISGRDEAVKACEDDNKDYEVLVTAKNSWIAALALASVSLLLGCAVLCLDGKKNMFAVGAAAVMTAGTAVCVLIAFLELNSAPATEDVGIECVPGVACYEKESAVTMGLAAMICAILAALAFLANGVVVFLASRKGGKSMAVDSSRVDTGRVNSNTSDSDSERSKGIADEPESQV